MKDEEIKALRDRMIKMESIIPVQVRWLLDFIHTAIYIDIFFPDKVSIFRSRVSIYLFIF